MYVLALEAEVRLPDIHSLKAKRAAIRPILDGARRRFEVASAEVEGQDTWQWASLGFATVSSSVRHAGDVIDAVERFVWSFPEIEVVQTSRSWVEEGVG